MRLTPVRAALDRARFGTTLETWVHGELLKMLSLAAEPWFLFDYRDKDRVEADFVLESPLGEVIGIEAKASATVSASDFKGLKRLTARCGGRFRAGAVLYDGVYASPFGDGFDAIPLRYL